MAKDRRIVFQVDAAQADALKAESKRTGAPVSEILRRRLASPLAGKYFLSFLPDSKTLVGQGQISAEVAPGLYLVQVCDLVTGTENIQKNVPVTEMTNWTIFDSQVEMNIASRKCQPRQR